MLLIIVTINIPIYFNGDSEFIGFKKLASLNIVPIISLIFLILGLAFFSRFKYKLEGSIRTPFTITKIQNANYEHLTFLTTYIIPLICFDLDSARYIIVLFVVLIIIGAIYVETDMFYANPSLALLGYHIYKVDGVFRTGERNDIIIISRERLSKDMSVAYRKLDDKIYFVKVVHNE